MTAFKFIILFLHLLIVTKPTATQQIPCLNITIRTDNKDEFEVGTPRVLACVLIGCTPSLNVTWYLGDIILSPKVYKEVSRGSFTVSSLTFVPSLSDNGKELLCRAANGDLSQVFEDRVTISVGQRPKCVDSTYKTIRAVEGESQTLACVVESDPDPEQFVWSFPGGRTIYTSSKKVAGYESKYSSALVWVPQRDDYGPVNCRAFNRFGEQKQPCTFLVVNGVPSIPDCDFHWKSQEFKVPCGKNVSDTTNTPATDDLYYPDVQTKVLATTTPTPPREKFVFPDVHPEDGTPLDNMNTKPRFGNLLYWFGCAMASIPFISGCGFIILLLKRLFDNGSEISAMEEVQMNEIVTENQEPQV